MTATVRRVETETRSYAGEGTCGTTQVHVKVRASKVAFILTLTAQREIFSTLPEDNWYGVVLRDEQGNALDVYEPLFHSATQLQFGFNGTGALPERLTMQPFILTEDGGETALNEIPIELTPE